MAALASLCIARVMEEIKTYSRPLFPDLFSLPPQPVHRLSSLLATQRTLCDSLLLASINLKASFNMCQFVVFVCGHTAFRECNRPKQPASNAKMEGKWWQR